MLDLNKKYLAYFETEKVIFFLLVKGKKNQKTNSFIRFLGPQLHHPLNCLASVIEFRVQLGHRSLAKKKIDTCRPEQYLNTVT